MPPARQRITHPTATGTAGVALAVLSLLVFSVTPVWAARGHVFSRVIGWGVLNGKPELQICTGEPTPCLPGIAGSGKGQLKEPQGMAVNEANEDFYVVDRANSRVEYFSAAGAWLGEITGPNATGTGNLEKGSATITAATASTGAFSAGEKITGKGLPAGTTILAVKPGGALEVSNAAEATEAGVALAAHQAFFEPVQSQPSHVDEIVVDNACRQLGLTETSTPKTCKEVDPSNGDVYVPVDIPEGHVGVVDKFTADGEYLGQLVFNAPEQVGNIVEGVAVDRTGTLWVEVRERFGITRFYKLTDGEPNTVEAPFVQLNDSKNQLLSGFTLDSSGDFYVGAVLSPRSVFVFGVEKLSPEGKLLSESFDQEEAAGVATELPSNDVYVDNISKVRRFNSEESNEELEHFGEGHLSNGVALSPYNGGIAVDSTSREGQVYVADAANNDVVEFALEPPGAPMVEHDSVTNVTAESADLRAVVNPRGATSSYQLEYGPCASPGACVGSPYESRVLEPEGTTGAAFDFEPHAVTAHLHGLEPGTTYHFRGVAHNKNSKGGVAAGEEIVFTMQPAGYGFQLPDGRAWELVSPADKFGALVFPIGEGVVQAAASGDAMTYVTASPSEAQPEGYADGEQVLSSRLVGGWSSKDIGLQHKAATGPSIGEGSEYKFFSEDLSRAAAQPFGEFDPSISAEAREQTPYMRSNFPAGDVEAPCTSRCYTPLVAGAQHPSGSNRPQFEAASADGRHVVIDAKVGLTDTPEDTGGLYEWSEGAGLTLVSVLPGNKPTNEGVVGSADKVARHAISADGDRIVWTAGEFPNTHLYLREVVEEKTLELDHGLTGTPVYQTANADGSKVFFIEENGAERALYMYDMESEKAERLTVEGAEVQGEVVGASEDGSYLYFVANGKLAEGAEQGDCAQRTTAVKVCNLYEMYEEGGAWKTRLVAVLSEADRGDWSLSLPGLTARVSPDGRYLAFMSSRSLTSYNNRDVQTGKPAEEVYEFEAATGRVVCASCNPTGARPVAVEYARLEEGLAGVALVWEGGTLIAASVPGWTPITSGEALRQSRYLSDSGRLFFNSSDALVPQDGNGTEDVYEFEPVGVGAEHPCSTVLPTYSFRSDGCISLVSSGESSTESVFLDASESGGDVFFLTAARLTKEDVDTALDVYDAHECTVGSPCVAEPAEVVAPCATESSCKAPPVPQPAVFGAPASATFSGSGNVTPPPDVGVVVPLKRKPVAGAGKLRVALAGCRRAYPHPGGRRSGCEHRARERYAKAATRRTHR